jgi:hypothetical protein
MFHFFLTTLGPALASAPAVLQLAEKMSIAGCKLVWTMIEPYSLSSSLPISPHPHSCQLCDVVDHRAAAVAAALPGLLPALAAPVFAPPPPAARFDRHLVFCLNLVC